MSWVHGMAASDNADGFFSGLDRVPAGVGYDHCKRLDEFKANPQKL